MMNSISSGVIDPTYILMMKLSEVSDEAYER